MAIRLLLFFHLGIVSFFAEDALSKHGIVYDEYAGIAQLVERNLAKVEVASSNLVSRSKFFKRGV